MAKPLKAFTAPETKAPPLTQPTPSLADAPQVSANRVPEASYAIVGLLPTARPEVPTPKASQQAGFSTGPEPRATGGDDSPQPNQLVIPGLLARNDSVPGREDSPPALMAMLEAPTSLRNLGAAARSVRTNDPAPPIEVVRAVRVATPPDPRLEGRIVYALALQMPNVTSYSGSWIIWFAERDPSEPSLPNFELKPPVPLRKVDPKYVPAAAEERVEGKVRLAAIIRKTGHVESVELLRGLDNRLDQSAAEALAKWEFEPARINGTAIELDAIFDIPFHLAPKPTNSRPTR
jgi:protein TonB